MTKKEARGANLNVQMILAIHSTKRQPNSHKDPIQLEEITEADFSNVGFYFTGTHGPLLSSVVNLRIDASPNNHRNSQLITPYTLNLQTIQTYIANYIYPQIHHLFTPHSIPEHKNTQKHPHNQPYTHRCQPISIHYHPPCLSLHKNLNANNKKHPDHNRQRNLGRNVTMFPNSVCSFVGLVSRLIGLLRVVLAPMVLSLLEIYQLAVKEHQSNNINLQMLNQFPTTINRKSTAIAADSSTASCD